MQMASKNNRFHRLILIAQFYFPLWTRNSGTIRYFGQNWFYLLVTGFYWTSPNKRNAELKLGFIIRSRETLLKRASETHISKLGPCWIWNILFWKIIFIYVQQCLTVDQRNSLKGWWRDKDDRYISEINNIMSGQSHLARSAGLLILIP